MMRVHQRIPLLLIGALAVFDLCAAWSTGPGVSRKNVLSGAATSAAAVAFFNVEGASAFDGSGSSAYTGRKSPTKEELAKAYKARVVQDIKDFNALGAAIDRGETEGDDWVAFFIPYQRREPDELGRTYAARLDLIGEDGQGGSGLLLAGTFAKKGKPIDGLPQVKKFNAIAKTLKPIQSAAKSGDTSKAKKAWAAASAVLSDYLNEVELPESLSDPLYK
jgi:hypothetical protein